jgi:hypothetical protein
MKRSIEKVLAERLEFRLPEGAELLTTFEVARLLRLSRWTLCCWRKNGGGPPFVKLSRGIVRYLRAGLECYLGQALQREVTRDEANAEIPG